MQRLPKDHQTFVIATIAVAIALMWALSPQIKWEAWPELLLFLVLIFLASMFAIPNPRGGSVSATPPLFFVLFCVHGPGAGVLIASSAYAVGAAISRGWIPWRTLYNGAQFGISAAVGGLIFKALGGSPLDPNLQSFFFPFVIAALAHQVTNNIFVTFLITRVPKAPFLSTLLSEMGDYIWQDALSIPTAALLTMLYVFVHPGILLFYLGYLPLEMWALQLYLQQKRIFAQAIDSIVVAIDSDFPEGSGHSRRVAETARAIARKMKLHELEIEEIEMAALLHDVGTTGIFDSLESVPKAGSTDVERLREHVKLGAELARQLPGRGESIAKIIYSHHENYNGSGYLRGLKGPDIPIGARIVGVAEAYESMIASEWHTGARLSPPEAMATIKEQSGITYDPNVVRAFIAAFEDGSIVPDVDPVDETAAETVSGLGSTPA